MVLEPKRPIAGEGLLHPVCLASVAVLLLNDHVLKRAVPGVITGKLSDLAGLIFFPLLLQAFWEVGAAVLRRPWTPSVRVLGVSALLTGLGFSAIQVLPWGSEAYRTGLGLLQWPFTALSAWLASRSVPGTFRVHLTPDVTDLFTLPALGVALWLGWRRAKCYDEG